MGKEKLLVIFVDALRPDFITKEATPYLYHLTKDYLSTECIPILGYSDAIRATIFTGTYPDKHGYWMKYQYSPQTSPFRQVKWLRFIDHLPSPFLRSGINLVLSKTLFKTLAKIYQYHELASYNIPYNIIDNFDFTLKKSILDEGPFEQVETIFDILRSNNVKYLYIESSSIKSTLRKISGGERFVMHYLSDIDAASHRHGLFTQRFFRTLKQVDRKIESLIEKAKEKMGKNLHIIVFSDHGMSRVNEICCLEEPFGSQLKDWVSKGRLLYAVDATMIRFWYLDQNLKKRIRQRLNRTNWGRFITSEKEELKISFNHTRYGEDIFLLKQGKAFYPNFMSWLKPKAMHAYHPKNREQRGIFILAGAKVQKTTLKPIEQVQIMPTILDILGIEVPSTVQGKSIIE